MSRDLPNGPVLTLEEHEVSLRQVKDWVRLGMEDRTREIVRRLQAMDTVRLEDEWEAGIRWAADWIEREFLGDEDE